MRTIRRWSFKKYGTHVRFGLFLAAGLLACGCSPGINWKGYVFEPVFSDSQANKKLTFVYFRHWYSPTSTEFEEKILKDPSVRAATTDMNCVVVEFDNKSDNERAIRWGLTETPAFAVLSPEGGVLASGYKTITLQSLLAALEQAKSGKMPPSGSQPATTGQP